jgi:hypothetical protein
VGATPPNRKTLVRVAAPMRCMQVTGISALIVSLVTCQEAHMLQATFSHELIPAGCSRAQRTLCELLIRGKAWRPSGSVVRQACAESLALGAGYMRRAQTMSMKTAPQASCARQKNTV